MKKKIAILVVLCLTLSACGSGKQTASTNKTEIAASETADEKKEEQEEETVSSEETTTESAIIEKETAEESEAEEEQEEEQEVVEEIEYTNYPCSKLVVDLNSNALSANREYLDQYVSVTGELYEIDGKGEYVCIGNEADNSLARVQCNVTNDALIDSIIDLKKGNLVTVYGKVIEIDAETGYSIEMYDIERDLTVRETIEAGDINVIAMVSRSIKGVNYSIPPQWANTVILDDNGVESGYGLQVSTTDKDKYKESLLLIPLYYSEMGISNAALVERLLVESIADTDSFDIETIQIGGENVDYCMTTFIDSDGVDGRMEFFLYPLDDCVEAVAYGCFGKPLHTEEVAAVIESIEF